MSSLFTNFKKYLENIIGIIYSQFVNVHSFTYIKQSSILKNTYTSFFLESTVACVVGNYRATDVKILFITLFNHFIPC